jgi:hypothetical protein
MDATTYTSIPEELWQQGEPPTKGSLGVLVRWESVPVAGGSTTYVHDVLTWSGSDWTDETGWPLEFTYPDTVRYIVLQP